MNIPEGKKEPGLEGAESYPRLKSRLLGIRASSAVIFSDMTSTLIYQTPQGFPAETKSEIARLLEAGCALILVTGDTRASIEKEFFEKLSYSGEKPVYVISLSGYLIYEWKSGSTRELYRGQEMSRSTRELAFEVLEQLIGRFFFTGFKFDPAQKNALLGGEGCRINFGSPFAAGQASLLVEGAPNKVTAFSPGSPQADARFTDFLDAVVTHPLLVGRVKLENLHLVKGGNYFDLISSRKEQGILNFLKLSEGKALDIKNRQLLVMGDSENDTGMLKLGFSESRPALRIYLGNDENLVTKEFSELEPDNFFFLKGSFIEGGGWVLSQLK